ncbi:MAG: hypothetical protein OHK93_007847 [Ramalina farinacea]|uniref:Uncharacterized protein n=1 Tax=Ramalina farinacea TaxID=258253 RepID=A0AA43QMG8_9LECA|nr:hypothetical protein [Ramalina farinacea]
MTGYEESLNHTRHGARDREHFYIETVISAYEGGKKVADLDLLKVANEMVTQESQFPTVADHAALRNPLLRFPPGICNHDDGQRCDASIFGPLTSLDNWFEVLDRPANSAIMRAQGNSLARLALAALCVEKKIELIVFPERQVCWACARETLEIDREDPEDPIVKPHNPSLAPNLPDSSPIDIVTPALVVPLGETVASTAIAQLLAPAGSVAVSNSDGKVNVGVDVGGGVNVGVGSDMGVEVKMGVGVDTCVGVKKVVSVNMGIVVDTGVAVVM